MLYTDNKLFCINTHAKNTEKRHGKTVQKKLKLNFSKHTMAIILLFTQYLYTDNHLTCTTEHIDDSYMLNYVPYNFVSK